MRTPNADIHFFFRSICLLLNIALRNFTKPATGKQSPFYKNYSNYTICTYPHSPKTHNIMCFWAVRIILFYFCFLFIFDGIVLETCDGLQRRRKSPCIFFIWSRQD